MTINRQTPLLNTSMMTPMERQMGRFMRAPDHPIGGENGNNTQVNSGGDGNQPNPEDNSSKPFDAEAFWSEAGGDNGNGPSGESVQQPVTPSATQQQQQTNPASELATRIGSLNFGELMTQDVMAKLNEGDTASFNQGIQQFGQNIVKATLMEVVQILKPLREQIFGEIDTRINSRSVGDKQFDALTKAIPSAASPKMGPTIKNIYQQALAKSKGNIETAIQYTRDVLKTQAEIFGADVGLEIAPRTQGDNIQQPKTTNWLEALAER